MPKPVYIMTWTRSRVELVGPFPSHDAASRWADTWFIDYENGDYTPVVIDNPNNPSDNPCWSVLSLPEGILVGVGSLPEGILQAGDRTDEFYPIRVRSPESGPIPPYDEED